MTLPNTNNPGGLALITDSNLGGLVLRVQFRKQNDPRFTDSFVVLALNKAVTRLMMEIRNTTSIFTGKTFVLTEGEWSGHYAMEYPCPPDTLWIDSLSFDGQQPMRLMSQMELAVTGIERSNGVGDPAAFYVYDQPNGQKVAVIYPRPSRVATLEFYGGVMAPPMKIATDKPPFLPMYFEALEIYAEKWILDGQIGSEARVEQLEENWIKERAEMKFYSTINRVSKTMRRRDIP